MHDEADNGDRLSYDTYSQMPDDGNRYEILDGKIHISPTPSLLHQYALGELYVLLVDYFKEPTRAAAVFVGRLTMILSDAPPRDAEIVEPDLIVVKDRTSLTARGIRDAPWVAVEVFSPGRELFDRAIKLRRYAANGIEHYWMVDPDGRTMECGRLVEGHYLLDAEGAGDEPLSVPAFPGLTIDLGKLWLRLDPAREAC